MYLVLDLVIGALGISQGRVAALSILRRIVKRLGRARGIVSVGLIGYRRRVVHVIVRGHVVVEKAGGGTVSSGETIVDVILCEDQVQTKDNSRDVAQKREEHRNEDLFGEKGIVGCRHQEKGQRWKD